MSEPSPLLDGRRLSSAPDEQRLIPVSEKTLFRDHLPRWPERPQECDLAATDGLSTRWLLRVGQHYRMAAERRVCEWSTLRYTRRIRPHAPAPLVRILVPRTALSGPIRLCHLPAEGATLHLASTASTGPPSAPCVEIG